MILSSFITAVNLARELWFHLRVLLHNKETGYHQRCWYCASVWMNLNFVVSYNWISGNAGKWGNGCLSSSFSLEIKRFHVVTEYNSQVLRGFLFLEEQVLFLQHLFLQVLLLPSIAITKKQKTLVVALLIIRTGFNSLRCLAFCMLCGG